MNKIIILALSLSASTFALAQTVTYSGAPDPIPDNDLGAPLCTSVTMPGSATVSSANFVQVEFSITHTWLGDLNITLESPGGTVVALRDRAAINAGGFGDSSDLDSSRTLSFADTAGVAIADMGAACGGTAIVGIDAACADTAYIPSVALAGFNGEAAAGTWTLCVGDGGAGDTGDLASWSMVGDGTLPVELQTFSID